MSELSEILHGEYQNKIASTADVIKGQRELGLVK